MWGGESTNGRLLNRPAKRLALSLQRIKSELCDVLSAGSQPAAGWDHKTCSYSQVNLASSCTLAMELSKTFPRCDELMYAATISFYSTVMLMR